MNYVSKQNIDNIVKGLSNKISMSVSNGSLIGDTTPVGTVISFMGTQAPLYYLVCDGSTYNIEEYNELANFIEAQFGSKNYFGGDGTTTFAVPDLRGEFLRGTGTNSHTSPSGLAQGSGENVGVHQNATEINKSLAWTSGTSATSGSLSLALNTDKSTNAEANADSNNPVSPYNYLEYNTNIGTQSSSVVSPRYTVRPTNTSVLYCIKYTKAVIPSEYEDGTPVGRVIFDSILREGYIKANGAQIEDATIAIPRLLSFVQKYSSQILAPDQATYESNVGLYMYDSTNDVLTLPNYIGRVMQGGNSIESKAAGLPNIKDTQFGSYFITWNYTNTNIAKGIVKGKTANQVPSTTSVATGEANRLVEFTFDASNYNAIYSDSVTTVQPPAIQLIPQIRY